MITMNVYAKENTAPVIVEAEAVAGLQKLARIFCGDIEKVTGHQPECVEGWQEMRQTTSWWRRVIEVKYWQNWKRRKKWI